MDLLTVTNVISRVIYCLLFSIECVKVLMPAQQVLPLTRYIFKASCSTLVGWVIRISGMGQSELGNLSASIGTLIYSILHITFRRH